MPFYIYAYFFLLSLVVLFMIHYDNKRIQEIEELHARDTEEWKNSNNYPQFDHDISTKSALVIKRANELNLPVIDIKLATDKEVSSIYNQNDKPS